MSVSAVGTGYSTSSARTQGPASAGSAAFDAALEAFKAEASKTPAERARDEVLKKHNLSEEAYRTLPEHEREAIDREIVEAVRRTIRGPSGQGRVGQNVA